MRAAAVVGKSSAGFGDLALLPRPAWIGALVITTEQKDEAIAMSVAEDAQQDALTSRLLAGGLAERAEDLGRVVSQPELEQSLAELLAVGASTDRDPLGLENLRHRHADRSSLRRRQIVSKPSQHGLVARGVSVELKLEARHPTASYDPRWTAPAGAVAGPTQPVGAGTGCGRLGDMARSRR